MSSSSFCEVILVILMVNYLRALQAACPPGWWAWQDSCYILLSQKMNYADASKACDQPGVSLVLPNSMEEQISVWNEMSTRMRELGAQSSNDHQLWINCKRYDAEHFLCSGYEGTSSFRYWSDIDPSDGYGEDCVRMAGHHGGKWADRECYFNYFVACEMRATVPIPEVYRKPSHHYIHVPLQCLLNHQIKSYPVNDFIGCGLACWAESRCHSFNLWKQADNKMSCQLNHASHMEADVTDVKYEENCYFYDER